MSQIDLSSRVAIVTGAGGGLGRSHALALAERGARVVVNDNAAGLHGEPGAGPNPDDVVAEIRARGGEALANVESVADPEGARRLVDAAVDTFGSVDIVVNNAGVLRDSSLPKMTVDDIRTVLDVHLVGTILVSQAAFAPMKAQGYGRFVHTSSASGLFGNFGQCNYSAAKAGIAGFSRTLTLEGAKYGIQSNTIAPTAETRMTEGLLGSLVGRVDPDLVSPLVVYLACDACQDSGEVFTVGGGRFARVVTGFGPGWIAGSAEVTADDVADHWDAIRSIDPLRFPPDTASESAFLMERLGLMADL